MEFLIKRTQEEARIVDSAKGAMAIGHVQLFVSMKVVGRSNYRDDQIETVLAQPDDFFLASDSSVILAVAAGALADGELVFDDPGEIPRGDPQRPFSAKLRGHSVLLLVSVSSGRINAPAKLPQNVEGEPLFTATNLAVFPNIAG
ncbi:MAG: hypothetical protein RIR69_871 [Actinomycetota bacterium]